MIGKDNSWEKWSAELDLIKILLNDPPSKTDPPESDIGESAISHVNN